MTESSRNGTRAVGETQLWAKENQPEIVPAVVATSKPSPSKTQPLTRIYLQILPNTFTKWELSIQYMRPWRNSHSDHPTLPSIFGNRNQTQGL